MRINALLEFLKDVKPGLRKRLFQDFSSECIPKNLFSYFSTKTYVVGTQKNRLNETVLLSTQNIC